MNRMWRGVGKMIRGIALVATWPYSAREDHECRESSASNKGRPSSLPRATCAAAGGTGSADVSNELSNER